MLTPEARTRRARFRRVAAAAIVVAWVVALGGLVRRDVMRTAAERMAGVALRVNPGNFFYAVERDGRHVGYASSTIDTLPDTSAVFVMVREALVHDQEVGGSVARVTQRTDIALSRSFALLTFAVDSGAPMSRVSGRLEDDSIVAFSVEVPGGRSHAQRVRVTPPVLLPALVPLAAMLDGPRRVGRRVTYRVFDPAARAAGERTVQIRAESLFVVDDSARMDVPTGRWVSALRDTVRAWRLVDDRGEFDGWLDAQGRLVELSSGSTRLRRMAYELAFENWRLDAEARSAGASAHVAPARRR